MTGRLARGIAVAFLLASATRAFAQTARTTGGNPVDRIASDYMIYPNIVYRTANNVPLKLDLYLPPGERKPAVPVVINIHGGGWVAGTKEEDALVFLPYLEMGWAAVNVEYRLAE